MRSRPVDRHQAAAAAALLSIAVAAPAAAQQASLIYRLGKDTVAVETWTRTGNTVSGEMAQRSGAAVQRVQYTLTLGRDGRIARATFVRRQQDGAVAAGQPNEFRLAFGADSAVRELAFADSTPRRAFAARGATAAFPVFVYGPFELIAAQRRAGGGADSLPTVGAAGGVGFVGLEPMPSSGTGSVYRLRGQPYAMLLTFDARDRLLGTDGSFTTNKAIGTRVDGAIDVAALAKGWRPTGVLSARADVRAAFGPGGMVVVDYGRPQVRERTVWGGTLVPLDSVWRAGANDATHLFTTRALTFGGTTLPAGSYTLWVQHTAAGTFLIVNRQVGQWGTQYDAQFDAARVPMELGPTAEHVEEFTITVRATGPAAGRLEMAWADKVASVGFTVSSQRP